MNDTQTFKTHEETVADVLSRYSVLDLTEMTDGDLARGDAMYLAADGKIEIVDQGERNLIRWWKITTDGGRYEVRRFENFVWCSCKDFFFNHTCCKHISVSTTIFCIACKSRLADSLGQKCPKCEIGGMLERGDHFRITCKSFKKTSTFRVESVIDDRLSCVDVGETEGSVPRCNYGFRIFQIDEHKRCKEFKLLPPDYGQTAEPQRMAA